MARHRFDENDKDNDKKWGGPELAERTEEQPQRHRRDRDKAQALDPDSDRPQPPQR
ncbi:hypothetical protein LWP59_32495 [Amycolatopsis acidiphila]|uniref:hypothetical protein n=1 Tax=Amycolatopsis acidiphila TaxID=715473 RepID=UPI001643C49F|nr:hypothetical protein [Amycolatopsis acidiphila]UIJ58766.1 hypothetical protein LWP59_32495 [Amycolatopsis acidiphila]GHG71808.1 hypothetical protein GCM10017788_33810 [Amycolatopsis acidiphila]